MTLAAVATATNRVMVLVNDMCAAFHEPLNMAPAAKKDYARRRLRIEMRITPFV
jgi:hypothetical protein